MTFGVTKKEANANLTIYNAFNPIMHKRFLKNLSVLTNLVEFKSRSNIL
jgi:TATA-binding protein-associated factor Taf7